MKNIFVAVIFILALIASFLIGVHRSGPEMNSNAKIDPVNTGYDSTIYSVLLAKNKAYTIGLENELDSLKSLEPKFAIKYIYLKQFVVQDTSSHHQLVLMSALLKLHTLKDSMVDTSGTILQQGNKRLIEYLTDRELVELKDNIIKVQGSIIRSLNEQSSIDSADRQNVLLLLGKSGANNIALELKLETAKNDFGVLKKKRNGWRVLAAGEAVALVLKSIFK